METDKKVFADSAEASAYCADTLADIIKQKPDALICLAAGHTSLELFGMLIKDNREGKIDFSRVRAVGLDECRGFRAQTTAAARTLCGATFTAVSISGKKT
jgi:6-phosphogluconolactonase/glucosamine-6-phosphate isomerase/deaminase